MTKQQIPDIKPFVANDQFAIRCYLVFALSVFFLGILIAAIAFHPTLQSVSEIQKVGGAFVASLSAFPLKEFLVRRDRLHILFAIELRIAQLRSQADAPEEDVTRLTDLVWEIYRKGATG